MEFLSTTDLDWIRPHLPVSEEDRAKAELSIEALEGAGGLNAAMRLLLVHIPDNAGYQHRRFIFKTVSDGGMSRSKDNGCPREAIFYNEFAPKLRDANANLPVVLFAQGDMETGQKVLIMEDLGYNGIQSGYFFGAGSPLNWGKDLPALLSKVPTTARLSAREIALDTFIQAAKLHRTFWGDRDLLTHNWLRCSKWMIGESEDTFHASMRSAVDNWHATKARISEGTNGVKWDGHLIACMDASVAKVNFQDYVSALRSRKWTLVHGDLHPANIMWVWGDSDFNGKSVLLDWEVVGVGSGPQDLAQYLISHMEPSVRRSCERELVETYYKELIVGDQVADYSFEECWSDYRHGGLERWVWLLALLSTMCPDSMNQYFQDQVAAFMLDHNITPENIGMPRV